MKCFKKHKKRKGQSGIQANGAHRHGGVLICSTLCHWALERLTNSGTMAIIGMIYCIGIHHIVSVWRVLWYLLYLELSWCVMYMTYDVLRYTITYIYIHHMIRLPLFAYGISLPKPRNSMKESITLLRETLAWCCMSTFHPSSHMLNPIGSRISTLWVSKRHGTKFKLCHYYIMLEHDLPVNFPWTSASSIKMNQVLLYALSRMSDLEDGTNHGTWKIIQAPKQMMDWQILTFGLLEKGPLIVRVICILLRW